MKLTTNPTRFTLPQQPKYDHIQTAPLYWLVLLPVVVLLVAGIGLRAENPEVLPVFLALGTVLVILAFSFRRLRIRDEGELLAVRFGPLRLFWKRFAYADLASVDRDKTSWVDGWGIHWVPRRGWTYNLWGFDCVRLTLQDGRTVRLGTDDPAGLLQFLQDRLQGR